MFFLFFTNPPSATRDPKKISYGIQGAAPSPTNLDMLLHLVVPGDLGRWEQCQQLCMFSISFVCLGWWNGSSFVVCCVYVEYSVCIAYHMYKYIYIYVKMAEWNHQFWTSLAILPWKFGQDLAMLWICCCWEAQPKPWRNSCGVKMFWIEKEVSIQKEHDFFWNALDCDLGFWNLCPLWCFWGLVLKVPPQVLKTSCKWQRDWEAISFVPSPATACGSRYSLGF